MTTDTHKAPPSRLRKVAWLQIPFFVIGIVVLWFADLRTSYESPTLLITLNLLFSTGVSLFVSLLCGRSFLTKAEPSILLLGCGVLVWGTASGVAAFALAYNSNITVTVHNLGVFLSAVCMLAGAVLAIRLRWTLRASALWLTIVYSAGLMAVALIVELAYSGRLPVFFIQGQGGTGLRQAVLLSAIALLTCTSILLGRAFSRSPSAFLYWFTLGLAMLAIGLAGVLLQAAHGSLLGWTGRIAQYLGGAYMLVAALASVRETGAWEIRLDADVLNRRLILWDDWLTNLLTPRKFLDQPTVLRYGLGGYMMALVATALSALLRFLLPDVLSSAPYLGFYPAVVVASALGGVGPGLVATFTSLLLVNFVFGHSTLQDHGAVLRQVIWVASGIGVSLLSGWLRVMRQKAEAESVTARAAGAALRESEERYRTLFTSLQENFYLAEAIYDTQGALCDAVYLEVNSAFERLLGLKRDQIVGKRMRELVPNIDKEWFEVFENVLRSGEPVTHSGYSETFKRHFEAFIFRPTEGHFGVLVTDITNRKEAETQNRRQMDEIELIYRTAPVGMCFLDSELRYVRINEVMADTNGLPVAAHIGKTMFQAIPELAPFIEPGIRRVLETGEPVSKMEVTGQTAKEPGMEHTWLVDWVPVRDETGKVIGVHCVTVDITERKRIETDLRQSRSDMDRAQAVGQIGSWRLDIRKNILTWSDENYRIFGLPKNIPLNYESFLGTIHPEDRQYVDAQWQAALRGEPYDIEHRLVVGDAIKWVREKAYLEFDKAGQLLGGFGITQDITTRKQAQELVAQESQFRLLAESMPQIVWATLPDGRNAYFNHQWVEYTGLTLEESYGHGWNKPFHPDDQKRAWDAWQYAVTHRGTYSLECRLRRVDGIYRWWLIRGTPLIDKSGMIQKWVGTCTDIDEIKQAEAQLLLSEERERAAEALRESENRFRTLANAMPQLAWIANADGWIHWYNQRWYDYTGTTPEQMEGWGWQSVHDTQMLPQVLALWQESLATGKPFDMTFPLRGADGVFRLFLTRGYPVKDASGKVLQWFGTNTDISDRQKAEEQIKQQMEELQKANTDMARFNHAAVGREMRMIELKNEINALCRQAGLPLRYPTNLRTLSRSTP